MNLVKTSQPFTMAVDMRWNCYYNEEMINKEPRSEVEATIVHEIYHLLRRHPARSMSIASSLTTHEELQRHKKLWNLAADAEINDDLKAEGFDVRDTWFFPSTMGMPDNLLAEDYYYHLIENPEKADELIGNYFPEEFSINIGMGGDGSSSHGMGEAWETELKKSGLSEAEVEFVRRQVAEAIMRHPGHLSGNLLRWAEEMVGPPKVDWRKELPANIHSSIAQYRAGTEDYTYSRPSRRHQSCDIVFPSMFDIDPKFANVIDTSGSISDKDIATFQAEISGILSSIGGGLLRVLSVDAEVQSDVEVSSIEELKYSLKGGGGTDMGAAIRYLEDSPNKPDICIILTDGYTPWPSEAPSFQVIAVITTTESVPDYIKGIWLDGYNRS
jgi:predicted metal-dependent peptidase